MQPDKEYYHCEVTQSHVDKWQGLQTLFDRFAFSAENLCTVGDQLNDLPMLPAANHSFAMGNGNPELREHAKSVCGDHHKDGISDVVRYIV